jgi:predicted phage terminase large subunit-like protein
MASSESSPRIQRHASYQEMIAAAVKVDPVSGLEETSRFLCEHDVFFLLVYVLGRADVNRDWLFDRCNEIQTESDGHLDLWARAHYKSTTITFALTIQEIVKNPNITIGIFSHTRPIAKSFLRQIKRELESNKKLLRLYPDILWEKSGEAPKWSEDDGIIVKRSSNPKESTVEAWGLVDGQPTSRHFDLIIYDDVVTRESVTTPDMIQKTTDAWELSLNLLSENGRKRYIGTRYHFNDTYRVIMERKAAIPRIYTATVDGTVDGEPVLLTRQQLTEKRIEMGSYTYACQMLMNPKADETQGFNDNWLRFWEPTTANLNIYILCDPASEKKASSDYTVMLVIGRGGDDNYYLIDGLRDRLNLKERADALFAFHREYRPNDVGYEKYGMQADIEHMEDRMSRENYRFAITELKGNIPKNDRIRKLSPLFEAGRIYIPKVLWKRTYDGRSVDLIQSFIQDEYRAFPVSVHDDMLDCMARICDPDMAMVKPSGRKDKKFNRPVVSGWAA